MSILYAVVYHTFFKRQNIRLQLIRLVFSACRNRSRNLCFSIFNRKKTLHLNVNTRQVFNYDNSSILCSRLNVFGVCMDLCILTKNVTILQLILEVTKLLLSAIMQSLFEAELTVNSLE